MAAPFIEQASYPAVGILQISEVHAVGRAYGNTSWIHPLFDAVNAESAFVHIALRMDKAGVIGTGSHAGFASHALFVMHKDHAAPFMDMTCATGTTINAGRIIAVVAAFAANLGDKSWINACRVIDNPVASEAFRDLILGLAGHDAVHAAHAFLRIYDHAITSHARPPRAQKSQS
jgi:hypothetical protein